MGSTQTHVMNLGDLVAEDVLRKWRKLAKPLQTLEAESRARLEEAAEDQPPNQDSVAHAQPESADTMTAYTAYGPYRAWLSLHKDGGWVDCSAKAATWNALDPESEEANGGGRSCGTRDRDATG